MSLAEWWLYDVIEIFEIESILCNEHSEESAGPPIESYKMLRQKRLSNSERAAYIKQQLKSMNQRASAVLCLIGNGTAWRDWVDWELRAAVELGKASVAFASRFLPDGRLRCYLSSALLAQWYMQQIIADMECAAAKRT